MACDIRLVRTDTSDHPTDQDGPDTVNSAELPLLATLERSMTDSYSEVTYYNMDDIFVKLISTVTSYCNIRCLQLLL